MRYVGDVAWTVVTLNLGYYIGAIYGFYGWFPQ